eukprot:196525-Pyramimonas_sp.AAC.1
MDTLPSHMLHAAQTRANDARQHATHIAPCTAHVALCGARLRHEIPPALQARAAQEAPLPPTP